MFITHKKSQQGLTLLELVLVLCISMPCIVLVQNQIMGIFNSVISRNMLSSFLELSTSIGTNIDDNVIDATNNHFKKISVEKILKNQLWNINIPSNEVAFYAKRDVNNGFYLLSILSPPSNIKISTSNASDVLGGCGGIIHDNTIYSFNNSFKKINLNEIGGEMIPNSSFACLKFFKTTAGDGNKIMKLKTYIKAGDIIINNNRNIRTDNLYHDCFLSQNCLSSFVVLTWEQQNYTNFKITIFNGSNAITYTNIYTNVYYIPVRDLYKTLIPRRPYLVKVSGKDIYGNENYSIFTQKIEG